MKSLNEVRGKKTAVFAFGRMNPPTTGHEKLIKKVVDVASKNGATPFVFVSHTQDTKKNPLSAKDKVKYLKLGVPEAASCIVYNTSIRTPFDALGYIKDKGYTDVILVAGSDRVNEMKKTFLTYVNHPDPEKSFDLDSFDAVSAGDRDPDDEGVAGISGTKMREAAQNKDFNTFKTGVPSGLSQKYAKELFNLVRKNLGIKESVESVQKPIITTPSINTIMKSFKTFISEEPSPNIKPPSTVDKTRDKQDRENDEIKARHDREMEKAREADFRQKENERKQKQIQKDAEKNAKQQESTEEDSDVEYVPEYLEDGTLVLVKTYKAATPGQ